MIEEINKTIQGINISVPKLHQSPSLF